ncbi:MAG TPA: FtsH protease activity modulator HflK, partial [Gammaproteobacteria bacterium]|nr:FtsH protease activity modulator HflK [Gammaproteobacteria bacterium]
FDRKFQANVTRERSYSKQGQMLTEDENIIEVPLTVQYKISDLQAFVLNVEDPEASLQHATDSAVRHVVGSTAMDQVLTEGREAMAGEVKERLQRFLDNYGTGIIVTQVNLQSAAAPREVQEAFDDVIRAREDEQRAQNQAQQYSNQIIPEARGESQRQIEQANAYREEVIAEATGNASRFDQLLVEYQKAPEVTRQRLYIEAVEDVMTASTKIMIDVEGGNNMLYLPLDKIMEQNGSGLGGASSTQDLRALAEQLSPYMPSANNNSNSIDRSRVPTNTRGVR